jgi:hypothetical protein
MSVKKHVLLNMKNFTGNKHSFILLKIKNQQDGGTYWLSIVFRLLSKV